MAFIEEARLLPGAVALEVEPRAGKSIQLAANQVPQRMAGEQIQREQHNINEQNQSAHANAKMAVKPESADGVIPEQAEEDDGAIQKIAVKILQDEREAGFATIVAMGRLADGTARRVHEKGAIVCLAI